jgi:sugar phosphate permease
MEHDQFRSLAARVRRFDALVLVSLLWFLGKFVRYAFPPLFERLSVAYDVSTAELGTAFSALLLVYAALQFPSGMLADRFSSVTVVGTGALLAAVGALAVSVEGSLAVLVGAMLVIGLGTGALKTVSVRLLSRTYPAETGRSLSVYDTFGSFGGVAAPAAVVVFAGLPGPFGAGWRTVFLLAGLTGVVVTAAFVLRVPDRLPDSTDEDATTRGARPSASTRCSSGSGGSARSSPRRSCSRSRTTPPSPSSRCTSPPRRTSRRRPRACSTAYSSS